MKKKVKDKKEFSVYFYDLESFSYLENLEIFFDFLYDFQYVKFIAYITSNILFNYFNCLQTIFNDKESHILQIYMSYENFVKYFLFFCQQFFLDRN